MEDRLHELRSACMIRPVLLALAITSSLLHADTIRVLIWDEQQSEQKQAYGELFLGETIAAELKKSPDFTVTCATLADEEQGLKETMLDQTDVIVFWSHKKNKELSDENAERIVARVKAGKLGLITLHSAHWSKPFVRLMQERAKSDAISQIPAAERASAKWNFVNQDVIYKVLKKDAAITPSLTKKDDAWELTLPQCVFPAYRADGAPSHATTLLPNHPIAKGLPLTWDIPHTEMYGGHFHVPHPDEIIFQEKWDKGEQFDSGCVWQVEKGKVFYFRPGHETYAIYQQAEPLKVIANAVRWLSKTP